MADLKTPNRSPRVPLIEDDLIKETARTNRRRAVEMVFSKYRDRLYYQALSIVKDPQEAYDAVQEVFIKAIREPRFFEAEFQMGAWLFRVTTNLCYNIVRDKRRRSNILEANPQRVPQASEGMLPIDQVFNGEMREEIFVAMKDLTPKHREILMLRYYDDLSYAEIAARLEIRLGTVMSRLSRARSRLMSVIGAENEMVVEAI